MDNKIFIAEDERQNQNNQQQYQYQYPPNPDYNYQQQQQQQPIYTQVVPQYSQPIGGTQIPGITISSGENSGKLTSEQAIQQLQVTNPINDWVEFQHLFHFSTPFCLPCGNYKEKSEITVPGLGTLVMGTEGCFGCGCCLCCCCCCKCDCDHLYPAPLYTLQNDKIKFIFTWNGDGKLYVYDTLVIEFTQCFKNCLDWTVGGWFSSMPQLIFRSPTKFAENYFKIVQEANPCPENPYNCCGCFSFLGFGNTKREIFVQHLSEGSVTVQNTRQSQKAMLTHFGCQDICCCDFCNFADYPDFQVTFKNVNYTTKLAVLMGLVHHTLYQKWEKFLWLGKFGIQNIGTLGRGYAPL